MSRTLFVTSALPYANGPIHLGHMVEHVQSDTWVRYQRMAGNTVTYCCADDAHGSGIMLKAEAEGVTPEQLMHTADQGGFFPPKSTWIEPKLRSGLFIHEIQ